VKARDIIAYAESKGWRFVRTGARSNHRIYKHPDFTYTVSIPDHGSRDIPRGTLATILKQIDGTWRPR